MSLLPVAIVCLMVDNRLVSQFLLSVMIGRISYKYTHAHWYRTVGHVLVKRGFCLLKLCLSTSIVLLEQEHYMVSEGEENTEEIQQLQVEDEETPKKYNNNQLKTKKIQLKWRCIYRPSTFRTSRFKWGKHLG